MTQNTALEITSSEYLIKLDKNQFDLGFIQSILKKIQNQQNYLINTFEEEEEEEEDIISRRSGQDISFDHLSEK